MGPTIAKIDWSLGMMNKKGLNYSLNYLKVPHTSWEVYNKLKKRDVSECDIQEIMYYLMEKGYIDDEIYTKLYLDYHLFDKGESKREVSYKLLRKGIDKNKINDILDNIQDYNEAEIIYQRIRKKFAGENINDEMVQLKIKKFFYNKGFSYEAINDAIVKCQ